MNKIVYCDFDFLRDFSLSCPQHNEDPLGEDPVQAWRTAYKFLYNSCFQLTGNIDMEAIKNNKLLFNLIKGHTVKFSNINDILERNSERDGLFSLIFSMMSQKERQETAKAYGIFLLGKDDVLSLSSHFGGELLNLTIDDKDKYHSWKDLLTPEALSVSNCMIIVDRYILKDTRKFDKNIFSLLEKILPKQTKVNYHISIYTAIFGSERDMQLRYDKIHSEIKKMRPQLDFSFEIVDSGNSFHNRRLITNNAYISCDKGFDSLFPVNKDGADIVFAFPFIVNHSFNKSFISLLKDLLYFDKNKQRYGSHVWGKISNGNRLISFYKNQMK